MDFCKYVWNNEQTEAFLDMNGSNTSITWIDENNVTKSTSAYQNTIRASMYDVS